MMPPSYPSLVSKLVFKCFLFQVLQDMVPPKKHLLRHQPANAQIGLMEGNTFCTTLQPRLFTMDLNVVEHKVFYTEVASFSPAVPERINFKRTPMSLLRAVLRIGCLPSSQSVLFLLLSARHPAAEFVRG